ncbi:MAG: histidine kinase [Leptolyngbyaceae cyanobacterium RU_5_1]|nr:histidine kinase [Leptolyngbyaceae cyanobacterium RU_5_1]
MQATPGKPINISPLQLLLFVNKLPNSKEQVQQVRTALQEFKAECDFELQIIDVSEQPHLAEYFRLIATPSLIKIRPEPRHTLAGSNLVEQLQHWWPYWQGSVMEYLEQLGYSERVDDERSLLDLSLPAPLSNPEQEDETTRLRSPIGTGTVAISTNEPPHSSAVAAPISASELQSTFSSITQSAELLRLSDEIFRLKQEKEELEHQIRFKDQIIAMLAHDLRNPLTAASLALETLEMGYSVNGRLESRLTPALTAQLLKHARTQTRAIDRMITDILQAARGASSELKIQPQKLNLGALCLDVLEHLRDRFQAKSQHVEKDIPTDLPLVLADGERVRQVIVNLLDNAIKYTPICGVIQLSALHRTTQKVQISVCDNGPGIPPENQERVFEDRFRLERDEDKEGYGIGLSLCQRIIRAHYGQIWVDSTPDQGSCFHFTLPVFRV